MSCAVLATLGAGLLMWPPLAGSVATALWGPLIMVPLISRTLAQRALAQRRYEFAARAGRFMALTHPVDNWPAISRLYQGLAQAQSGAFATATETLKSLASNPLVGWQAEIYILAIEDRWPDIAARAASLPPSGQGLVLRALGENGDIDDMVTHFLALGGADADRPADLRMMLAAFVGRPDIVRTLQATALSGHAPNANRFWLATAEQVAGHDATAQAGFEALAEIPDAILARAARKRLANPLPAVPIDFEENLRPKFRTALTDAWTTVHREDRLATISRPRRGPASGRSIATWTLLGLICGWFATQALLGGVENTQTLMKLGAMRSPLTHLDGEYWRILTAGWLHFGWAHFAVNALGLWMFGRFIEATLGRWRMTTIYLLSGIAAMASWLWLTHDATVPQAVVGASASIMGLVGAAAVVLVRRRRAGVGGRRNRRELTLLLLMVGLQIAFDMVIPQSSFVGHATGFGWGVVLTLIVMSRGKTTR